MLHVLFSSWYLYLLLSLICTASTLFITASASNAPLVNSPQPSEAAALLDFKFKADLKDNLPFSKNASFRFCQWQGVKCSQQKVVHLVVQGQDLGGVLAPDTLTRLDQLRVLSLQNNSLHGPIPDLSKLTNLKSLFLDHNYFTGSFPSSVRFLHRLRTLDLSYNSFNGSIPTWLSSLDPLFFLRLEWNRFTGAVPPLNQSSLLTFNVSHNNLSGAIPLTPTLIRFGLSSFQSNPNLCGEIIHRECHPSPPFFGPSPSSVAAAPPHTPALGQSDELHGVNLTRPNPKSNNTHKKTAVIIGFSSAAFVVVASLLCFVIAAKKQKNPKKNQSKAVIGSDGGTNTDAAAVMQIDQQESELEEKVKRVQQGIQGKSGSLVFCAGESQLYSLDQLMRGSAELLGRGTLGTTYKAVLDNRLIVSVKRLDAGKMAGTSKEMFERHMESVGGLRHPNLVPLRAYFQAKEERLLIYDYQPNGSLFSLIHGSKSARAKPLHWTSCLKIAEDVAQGLCYIHQAWRLVHGNLKSTNVLLGPDFEACVADYCLSVLAIAPSPLPLPDDDNPDVTAYWAPETRNSGRQQATSKSDVYAFGILLLELLTGKLPSELPFLAPDEMVSWVRSAREDEGGGEEDRLEMLLEVAMACSLTSSEQRPTMWQVLKMLQEIKETVLVVMEEDGDQLDPHSSTSTLAGVQ